MFENEIRSRTIKMDNPIDQDGQPHRPRECICSSKLITHNAATAHCNVAEQVPAQKLLSGYNWVTTVCEHNT